MSITFSNTAAAWGLLALPAIVAIHFFQQRSRSVVVSTRFLLEAMAPESRGGRTWERLRHSRALWLQLLATLLVLWVLAEPRWPREESSQTVVLVLDNSIAMQAFRDEALTAARDVFARSAGRAARTEWVVMTSDPRMPPLYRGPARAEAEAATGRWSPSTGTHDAAPALRLAQGLAGGSGQAWWITDTRAKAPPGQATAGVGRPFANVGFAGGTVTGGVESGRWQALVKNHAAEAQSRSWWIEHEGGRTPSQTVTLAAEGVSELGGSFPAGAERCVVVLAEDGFGADDRLPLVRPKPKTLTVRLGLGGATAAGSAAGGGTDEAGNGATDARVFFSKLLSGMAGVEFSGALNPGLRVVTEDGNWVTPKGAAIVLAQSVETTEGARWIRTPVVAEKNALVADLNWQGLLGPGPAGLATTTADEVLLWQGERALAWVRAGGPGGGADPTGRQLVLNFDWAAGNAGRLPATVLLLRRFVAAVQAAQPGAYAANFDAGAPVPLAEADFVRRGRRGKAGGGGAGSMEEVGDREAESGAGGADEIVMEIAGPSVAGEGNEGGAKAGETRVIAATERAVLRAPGAAGFFTVRRGGDVLVTGAAQFADVRQGDFRAAETFVVPPPDGAEQAALERNTHGDRYAAAWLALAGAALLGSWWPPRSGGGDGAKRAKRAAAGRKIS